MHAPLKLRESPTGKAACRLEVGGELDIGTASQLRRAIATLLGTGCRVVVVDLSETTFMDSSGLGALVWASHRLRAAGGRLTVVNPGERIARVLKVTGVDRLLLAER
jgi:anti-sigma B factor antagonist